MKFPREPFCGLAAKGKSERVRRVTFHGEAHDLLSLVLDEVLNVHEKIPRLHIPAPNSALVRDFRLRGGNLPEKTDIIAFRTARGTKDSTV